jgi:hypothetical protein
MVDIHHTFPRRSSERKSNFIGIPEHRTADVAAVRRRTAPRLHIVSRGIAPERSPVAKKWLPLKVERDDRAACTL